MAAKPPEDLLFRGVGGGTTEELRRNNKFEFAVPPKFLLVHADHASDSLFGVSAENCRKQVLRSLRSHPDDSGTDY